MLDRALAKAVEERERRTGEVLKIKEPVTVVLERITKEFRADVQGQCIAKRNAFFRSSKRDSATITTETIQSFDAKWANLGERMQLVPGKETLKAFREYAQTEYGVSLTDYRLADEFKRDEVPEDMKQLVERLEVFRTGAGTLIT